MADRELADWELAGLGLVDRGLVDRGLVDRGLVDLEIVFRDSTPPAFELTEAEPPVAWPACAPCDDSMSRRPARPKTQMRTVSSTPAPPVFAGRRPDPPPRCTEMRMCPPPPTVRAASATSVSIIPPRSAAPNARQPEPARHSISRLKAGTPLAWRVYSSSKRVANVSLRLAAPRLSCTKLSGTELSGAKLPGPHLVADSPNASIRPALSRPLSSGADDLDDRDDQVDQDNSEPRALVGSGWPVELGCIALLLLFRVAVKFPSSRWRSRRA
ncbi:MAG TPA: hypothetical protein VGD59_04845 [Acidisarcina sp.]